MCFKHFMWYGYINAALNLSIGAGCIYVRKIMKKLAKGADRNDDK